MLRFEGLDEFGALATRAARREPMIPSYQGGKFPLSTYLAERVREMLADPANLEDICRRRCRTGFRCSASSRWCRGPTRCWSRPFPRAEKHYMVCYPFEGRLAHQTLGMLLTRRLERWGAQPLGFVASEYALVIWTVRDLVADDLRAAGFRWQKLFDEDMMGDDLDAWLAESNLMKRTFRNAAIIAGLIERRFPGKEKTAAPDDGEHRPDL